MALGPIFIVFILFDKTKYLFDTWFKLMVKFTIQPVLLLVGLIIINGMLSSIISEIFSYYVCYKCTIPFTFAIPGFPEVGTTTLFCVSWFSAWGADNVDSPAAKGLVSIPLAITFCMITSVMRIYTDKLSGDVAKKLTGSSSMLGGGKHKSMGLNPFSGLNDTMKSVATFTGAAKDEKEYKALRNKMLKGAAALSLAASTAPLQAARFAARRRFSKKKDLDPKSLNNEGKNGDPQDNGPDNIPQDNVPNATKTSTNPFDDNYVPPVEGGGSTDGTARGGTSSSTNPFDDNYVPPVEGGGSKDDTARGGTSNSTNPFDDDAPLAGGSGGSRADAEPQADSSGNVGKDSKPSLFDEDDSSSTNKDDWKKSRKENLFDD